MTEELTATAARIRLLLEALAESGVDSTALCREAGIDPARLEQPEGRVSRPEFVRLWQLAQRAVPVPNLGLHLAERARLRAGNVVAYLAISSSTVRDALDQLVRFQQIIGSFVNIEVERRGELTAVQYRIDMGDAEVDRAVHEYNTLLLLRFVEWMTGSAIRPVEVAFHFSKPADPTAHERAFGCPVRFEAPSTTVVIRDADLDRPSMHAHQGLARSHRQAAERVLTELKQTSTVAALREVIREHIFASPRKPGMPAPTIDLAQSAKALSMSTRTLQRRLAEESSSFQKVYDALRQELVIEHLVERDTAIAEIADLAGFSDVSAFYRAFRRWTGTTPLQYRNSHR